MEVNVHQAKTHLSRLLQRVAGGEEITIARAGVPVAKLVAISTRAAARPLGMDRGCFTVPEDFDSPLPGEALALFEGKESADESRTAKQKTGQSRRRSRR